MENETHDEFLTVDRYLKAHRKLWYAVLLMFGFLMIGVMVLAYTLREEGIQRSSAVRVLAEQNRALINSNSELAKEGAQAHDTLCTIRVSLAAQIERTQKFIDANAGQSDIFGIPIQVIEQGQRQDKAQLAAMDENLDNCEVK